MEFIAIVFAMLVTLALLALLWWFAASGRDKVAGRWERYATSRGLTFVPPKGEWPNRTPPGVAWVDGGARYRIEALGEEALLFTQVVGRPEVALLGTFALTPLRSADAAASTGDPLIDTRFQVESSSRDLSLTLLTPDVKRSLVGFEIGKRGALTYERGDVTLRWAGAEENEARLDEARALVKKVVAAMTGSVSMRGTG